MAYHIDAERLRAFSSDLDIAELETYLQAFEKIALGEKNGGKIAQFEVPERFRWLTAMRSSILQTSRPHPGLCNNLDATLQRLFDDLVLTS